MTRMSVTLAALLLFACAPRDSDRQAEAETARTKAALEAKTAEVEVTRETVVRLEGEVRSLRDENAKLQSQVEILKMKDDPIEALVSVRAEGRSCQEDLKAARAEARMYREGLERAVEEMNRRAGRSQAAARRAETSRDAKASDRNVFVREPYVTSDGQSTVYVEGTIHNTNDVGVGGYLEITLNVDGRFKDSTTLTMDLQANTVHDYSHTFSAAVPSGVVQVTAAWGSGR